MSTTINAEEISNFTSIADKWWDETGPMRPLHAINLPRMTLLRRWLGGDIAGKRVVDVGCGGGLVCEPLARLGAEVVGVDAGLENIEAAKIHAAQMGLTIDYRHTSAEALADSDEALFDAVLALEIVEHVNDLPLFISSLSKLIKPKGKIIFSTLNRTPKSFALGIVAAEYILRWVPRGTHTWEQFVKPSELARPLRAQGLEITDITGLTYDPLRAEFVENADDVRVNYFLCAQKVS